MSPLPMPALGLARGRESPSRLRRGLRASLIAASTAIIAVVCAAAYWISALGPAPLGTGLAFSTLVVDRDGKTEPIATAWLLGDLAYPCGSWLGQNSNRRGICVEPGIGRSS